MPLGNLPANSLKVLVCDRKALFPLERLNLHGCPIFSPVQKGYMQDYIGYDELLRWFWGG